MQKCLLAPDYVKGLILIFETVEVARFESKQAV